MTTKKRRERSPRRKRTKGQQVNLWVQSDTAAIFDALVAKWSAEGKIPARRSAAFAYMVKGLEAFAMPSPGGTAHNYGDRLPLNPDRRAKLDILIQLFQSARLMDGPSDFEALNYTLDYAFEFFRRRIQEKGFLERFIASGGTLPLT